MDKTYNTFYIKKPSGKYRKIQEPNPELKTYQHKVRKRLDSIPLPEYVLGFREGRSIFDNAGMHVGAKRILNIDLKDFFPTITKEMVEETLSEYIDDATYVAEWCTLDGRLPQGSPASPVISNLVALALDQDIYNYCTEYNLVYTRYADDITVSGNNLQYRSKLDILRTIKDHGFNVNYKKIKTAIPGQSMRVTGLNVQVKVNTDKRQRRLMRAIIHRMEQNKDILVNDNVRQITGYTYEQILGTANFLYYNREDNDKNHLDNLIQYLTSKPDWNIIG